MNKKFLALLLVVCFLFCSIGSVSATFHNNGFDNTHLGFDARLNDPSGIVFDEPYTISFDGTIVVQNPVNAFKNSGVVLAEQCADYVFSDYVVS